MERLLCMHSTPVYRLLCVVKLSYTYFCAKGMCTRQCRSEHSMHRLRQLMQGQQVMRRHDSIITTMPADVQAALRIRQPSLQCLITSAARACCTSDQRLQA